MKRSSWAMAGDPGMGKSLLVGLRPPSPVFPSGRGCLASRRALPPPQLWLVEGGPAHRPYGPLPSRPQLRGGRDGLLRHGAGRGPAQVPGPYPRAGRGPEGGAADRGLQVRAGPAGKRSPSEARALRAESPFSQGAPPGCQAPCDPALEPGPRTLAPESVSVVTGRTLRDTAWF